MKALINKIQIIAFIAILACCFSFSAEAQSNNERIKSMQIAIMTDKLDLTAKESQAFWPIYNNYQNDLKSVRKDIENMSNLSAAKRLETKKNLQRKKLDIQGEYEEKFKKIMSIEKVAKIDQAEREFKKWLVEQLKRQLP
ncbi:MAG: hypothetical protein ACPG5B_04810 [Chitinophagales bacterium]